MPWLRTVHGSSCLEENRRWAHRWRKLQSFTFSTQVRSCHCDFIWTAPKFGNAEHIKYPKADPSAVKPGEKTTQLMRKSSTGPQTQEQPPRPSSAGGHVAHTTPPFQQAAGPEELRRAVSPPNTRAQRPGPNGLPSQPASVNGKPRRVIGADDDVESSTESVIRERALSPDQVRALSPPARGGTPTGPISIESMVKTVQLQRSESPLVERERTKSPDAQNYVQQQPNLASANGFTSAHGTKPGSVGVVTTDLIRDVKARDAELETLRRREAWMKAALAQALHAGFVYVNASSGDEDRGVTDEQPKIAEAVITLKKIHGRIQVRNLAVPAWSRKVKLRCLSHRRVLPNRHATRRYALMRPNVSGPVRSRRLRITVRNLRPWRPLLREKSCGWSVNALWSLNGNCRQRSLRKLNGTDAWHS